MIRLLQLPEPTGLEALARTISPKCQAVLDAAERPLHPCLAVIAIAIAVAKADNAALRSIAKAGYAAHLAAASLQWTPDLMLKIMAVRPPGFHGSSGGARGSKGSNGSQGKPH